MITPYSAYIGRNNLIPDQIWHAGDVLYSPMCVRVLNQHHIPVSKTYTLEYFTKNNKWNHRHTYPYGSSKSAVERTIRCKRLVQDSTPVIAVFVRCYATDLPLYHKSHVLRQNTAHTQDYTHTHTHSVY